MAPPSSPPSSKPLRFTRHINPSCFLHGRGCQFLLVHRFGVVLDLLQAGVAGNGRDLVRGAPRLGQAARGGLTEAVGAAMTQARHVTLLTEPLTEVACREPATELISQESKMIG